MKRADNSYFLFSTFMLICNWTYLGMYSMFDLMCGKDIFQAFDADFDAYCTLGKLRHGMRPHIL